MKINYQDNDTTTTLEFEGEGLAGNKLLFEIYVKLAQLPRNELSDKLNEFNEFLKI